MFFDLERNVIETIIGENPHYAEKLLNQYNSSKVLNRVFINYGFYTNYSVENIEYSLGDNIK